MLAAKVAHVSSWTAQKVKRASIAQDGSTIAEAFGAAFPVSLGRVDATTPDDPVQIPTQSSSPAEVKVLLLFLPVSGRYFVIASLIALFQACSMCFLV